MALPKRCPAAAHPPAGGLCEPASGENGAIVSACAGSIYAGPNRCPSRHKIPNGRTEARTEVRAHVGPEANAWSSRIPLVGQASFPAMVCRDLGLQAQNPKTARAVTQEQKSVHSIVSSTYIPTTQPNEPKNRTSPATIRAESRQGKGPLGGPMTDMPNAAENREETQSRDREGAVSAPERSVEKKCGDKRSGARKLETSGVEQESRGQATWRASPDMPCRHSWRHVFAGITSKPCRSPLSRSAGQRISRSAGSAGPSPTKTNKIQRKTATLSGSMTPAQSAPSTQTIENKNTIRRP